MLILPPAIFEEDIFFKRLSLNLILRLNIFKEAYYLQKLITRGGWYLILIIPFRQTKSLLFLLEEILTAVLNWGYFINSSFIFFNWFWK